MKEALKLMREFWHAIYVYQNTYTVIMGIKKVNRSTKVKVYRTIIRPTVTYSAETICLNS